MCAIFGLAGCAHHPDPDYSQLDMSDPELATLVGSYIKTPWPLGYEVTWVQATENRAMTSYEKSLGTVFPLRAGRRTVRIAFTQAALSGRMSFTIDVSPGARLVARSVMRNSDFVSMWIEDQRTGKRVTDEEVVQIRNMDSLYVPVYMGM